MEVPVGTGDLDLHVAQAFEAVDQRRLPGREERRVGDHHAVGREAPAAVLADVFVDRLTPGLLLPFDQELDVDRQAPPLGQHRRHRLEVGVGLPLVVRGAARHQLVPLHRGLERRMAPELDGIDRLHVVMPVEEDRGLARRAQPLPVHQRMAGGVDPFRLKPRRAHLVQQEVARAQHLVLVLRIGRDRGDADVVLQLLEVSLLLRIDAGEHVPRVASHRSSSPFRRRLRPAAV